MAICRLKLQEKSGYIKYLDGTVIECLQIASEDRRRGALGKAQLEHLKNVLPEYVAQVRELLEFKCEQETASIGERQEVWLNIPATAVVIAGRGIIDHAAAELVAEAIRSELGISTQCPSLGGLTGISAVVQAARDARMDIIVLVSVGELTRAQLDLLVSRAKRVFEGSAIVIGHWGGSTAEFLKEHDGGIFVAETVDVLVHTVGRIASERATNPRRPPPLKLV
jgi:hypothetical protein